ncbi:MAG TPA: hypothetical protein VH165_13645 [Kofleriaceae bacterium]|nr:hypothetical protein [Kofleriaceae bacterium]
MSRFALSTVLATALAMVPMAASAQVRVEGRAQITYNRDRDHYDRFDNNRWGNAHWVTIANGTGADGRREFQIGGNRPFRKIRIEAVRGAPAIEKLAIIYADNNTTQLVAMNSTLAPGGGDVIDLNGNERKIGRVVVYPTAHSRGAYSIYGE